MKISASAVRQKFVGVLESRLMATHGPTASADAALFANTARGSGAAFHAASVGYTAMTAQVMNEEIPEPRTARLHEALAELAHQTALPYLERRDDDDPVDTHFREEAGRVRASLSAFLARTRWAGGER